MRLLVITLLMIIAPGAWGQEWHQDILGPGYEMRYVDQGTDYSGKVRSTIVRHLCKESTHKAVLYIHGFNDYFFQTEMADEYVEHGYDFYAVDLRKYGRSVMTGQKMFQVRNLKEYFPDIDSALTVIRRSHHSEIILMGHSTGGLITSYYMAVNADNGVSALILNSPFLDWNLGKIEWLTPLVSLWGKLFPDTKIPQGHSTAYSESLLAGEHGEWNYNTAWKYQSSPDVDAGWVRAIEEGQEYLRKHKYSIPVPILLMYSSQSVDGDDWSPAHNNGDGVLDVTDIKKYGMQLGHDVTCLKVTDGLHDLVLSKPGVRYPLYRYIFEWLSKVK